jgi:hypothetical protein
MHTILRHGTKLTRPLVDFPFRYPQCRSISRNTAIAKGIREGISIQRGDRRRAWQDEERRPRSRLGVQSSRQDHRNTRAYDEQPSWENGGLNTDGEDPRDRPLGFSKKETMPWRKDLFVPGPRVALGRRHEYEERKAEPREDRAGMPLAVPYTTAASEFLYGHSAVRAALNACRRKLYTLYLHRRSLRDNPLAGMDADLHSIAGKVGVKVMQVGDDWLPLLDKMSGDRPHNVSILGHRPLLYSSY